MSIKCVRTSVRISECCHLPSKHEKKQELKYIAQLLLKHLAHYIEYPRSVCVGLHRWLCGPPLRDRITPYTHLSVCLSRALR